MLSRQLDLHLGGPMAYSPVRNPDYQEAEMAYERLDEALRPLEGDGFEPSVPRKETTLVGRPRSIPRNSPSAKGNRLLRTRNQWFESTSLR